MPNIFGELEKVCRLSFLYGMKITIPESGILILKQGPGSHFIKQLSLIPGSRLNFKTLSRGQFCIYSHNILYWTGGTSPPAQYK